MKNENKFEQLHSFDLRPASMEEAGLFYSSGAQGRPVGRVTYSSGEQQEFYDPQRYLQTIREELPYHATEGYYQNIGEGGFTERDHIRLRDTLCSIEGKFLLSYNDDAFIRNLYDAPGIRIQPVKRLNNLRQRYDPSCQFAELFIANYDMAERARANAQFDLFDDQKGVFDDVF